MTTQVKAVISVYSEPIDIGLNVYIEYFPAFPSESLIRLGLSCLSVKTADIEFSEDYHHCDIAIIYDGTEKDYYRNARKLQRFFNRRFRVQADLFRQQQPQW